MRKLGLVSVVMLAVACGGISSKEDAAKALGSVAQASKGAASSGQGQNLVNGLIGNIDVNASVTGTAGGKATVNGTFSLDPFAFNLTMKFENYSNGQGTIDGELTYVVTVTGDQSNATVDLHLKGLVTLSGTENDGELDMDIHMVSSFSQASPNSFQAKQKLKGTIKADGNTFTYDDEEFVVMATASAG